MQPISQAARPKAQVCGHSLVENAGLHPAGAECCVLSGRGLCDGLITIPEESYRMCVFP